MSDELMPDGVNQVMSYNDRLRETEDEQMLTGSERMYARIALLQDIAAITTAMEVAFAQLKLEKYEMLTSETYDGEQLNITIRRR